MSRAASQFNAIPRVNASSVGALLSDHTAGPLIGLGALLLFAIIAIQILRSVLRKKYQTSVAFKSVVMLVTVPKEQAEKGDSGQREKSLQEIQEDIAIIENVFSSIGGLKAERGLKAWFVGREDHFSFEIVAHKGLVSFYVAVPGHLKDFMVQQIQSQYPHAQVEEVPDYDIFSPQGAAVGVSVAFKRQHFFPIKTYKKSESDPLNGLTNALAKIDKTEGAAIQVVVRSAKSGWRRPALVLVREMHKGKTYREAISMTTIPGMIIAAFRVTLESKNKNGEPAKEHRMSSQEDEMIKSIDEKSSKLGLDVSIRIVASAKDRSRATMYLNNLYNVFAQYNIPQYGNSFVKGRGSSDQVVHQFIFREFIERQAMVMGGDELASVFHLPLSSTETPNIRWLTSRKSAPPPNLPKEGLRLGVVEYRGETTDVFIKKDDRMRHMYIIGKSGAGKSEYIAGLAAQDIANGDGICIIDPHGDLVETVLGTVPKHRADDVIVFDPSDLERPIALNMIEAPSDEMKDFVCGEMVAIFYKLFGAEMIGPMFEHQMRNYMLTLMSDKENPGTIAEIPRLVSDPAFQKEWRKKVTDPVVRSFWENEMDKTSDFHKSEMLGYLISKVGRFVENAMMRNIIGQQQSAFDFSDIMNKQKIFLVNLSKGKIGDINANLLGLIIVTKLQMAAMGRAYITDKSLRKDFFLYIDEFQNFITPSIATILSEARKYRLGLILAHQYMGQLSPKGDTEVRDAVLGNVGTMMIGRIGIEDGEVLEKEFAPVFTALDLTNVEKFTLNSKILIDSQGTRPFNIKMPKPVSGDARIAEALKQLSRLKYGRDRSIVEMEILERTQLKTVAPTAVDRPPAAG